MSDRIKAAAKMAGDWWAERLSDEYADRRAAFSAAVAARVERELRGECHWGWHGVFSDGPGYPGRAVVEFDYDPHNCLVDALHEALPGVPDCKIRRCLPQKHVLNVFADRLMPKEGYGNWVEDILVPNVDEVRDE